METRVSTAFGSLAPFAMYDFFVTDNLAFPESVEWLPASCMEPKSWHILEVLLHAERYRKIYCFLVSTPAKLLVSKKEDASAGAVGICLSAEGIEGFKLVSDAQVTECVKEGELFLLKKDFSDIQAGELNVLDLLNGLTDLPLLQIYSLRILKIRCQGSWFCSESGVLTVDGSQMITSAIKPSNQEPRRSWGLKKTQIDGQAAFKRQVQTRSTLKQLSILNQLDLPEESHAFQIQVNLLGKMTMLWVCAIDLVQDLLQKLECRLGIPSSCLRLLYKGKQLMHPLPLSFYSIQKDASIGVSFRLRGGSFGQTSSAPSFSYKDAARKNAAQPQFYSKETQLNEAPKPFLVDKSKEIPSINFSNPRVESCYQSFVESALICRFNGLWPRTADLYQWVHSFWTKKCKIFLCSKGFFLVLFDSSEDYQKALTGGPWFWGSAGLFLTPWFPDFDPSTAVISKLPIWVRLPNLLAHFWDFSVFLAIGNTLGRYLATDTSRRENGLYTYGRLCA